MTPDHDGQELSVKIKSPIPLTVAVLPSHLADQFCDRTIPLTDALDKTGCKERGVQKLGFNSTFNVANGPQTLLVLPEINFSGHKKADVEIETVMCGEHCELLPPPPAWVGILTLQCEHSLAGVPRVLPSQRSLASLLGRVRDYSTGRSSTSIELVAKTVTSEIAGSPGGIKRLDMYPI